jgi:hypothetical protein
LFAPCFALPLVSGPYLSSYVLVMTAIDRYQAICHPLANCSWTARRAKLMITGAWTIAMLCCAPQLFIFRYMQVPLAIAVDQPTIEPPTEYFECWGTFIQPWGEKVYVLWYAVSFFFIPLSILTFTYVNITKVIWINAKRNRQAQANVGMSSVTSGLLSTCSSTGPSSSNCTRAAARRLRTASTRFSSTNSDVIDPSKNDSWLSIGPDRGGWRHWLVCGYKLRHNIQLCKKKFHTEPDLSSKLRSNHVTSFQRKDADELDHDDRDKTDALLEEPNINNGSDHTRRACFASQTSDDSNATRTPDSVRSRNTRTNGAGKTHVTPVTTTTVTSSTTATTVTPRSHADPTKLSKAKIKTIKITVVVIICYISCSLPFVLVQLWAHWWPGAQTSSLWTGKSV